jgi:hypothetical protein
LYKKPPRSNGNSSFVYGKSLRNPAENQKKNLSWVKAIIYFAMCLGKPKIKLDLLIQ